MTTNVSSTGTPLPPSTEEKVHLRGFTSSRPTPQDSQPQLTLAANSDSLWTFPQLARSRARAVRTGGATRGDTAGKHSHSPGHGLQDGREAQRGLVSPPEGVVELPQAAAHGAAVPAALHNQSRPEVHLTVPVRRVDVSVRLEVGEHELHPLVVVPFRRQRGDGYRSRTHLHLSRPDKLARLTAASAAVKLTS